MKCFALAVIGGLFLSVGSAVSAAALTPAEIAHIETTLGITLSTAEKDALAAAVKPLEAAPWRTAAEARIDQHRKADLQLEVLDIEGNPLEGASVQLRQIRRSGFRFSGVLNLKRFAGETPMGISTDRYKALALEFFDAFGLGNGLKPKLRRGNEAYLPDYFSWLSANNVESRGHLLIWPGNPSNNHMTATVRAIVDAYNAETDPEQREIIKTNLKDTVEAEMEEWASLWPVYEWDVINEAIGNHEIQDILGDEIMADWFHIAQAHAVREDCRFLINDYQIISARSTGTTYTSRSTSFKAIIDGLIAQDAPLSGIGLQSRYKFERMDPDILFARLEEFAVYGLPMVGTEFHVPDREGSFEPSDALRAQMTEEIMTVYFSHPLVDGLTCWSFLDDRPEQAPLLDDDGNVNLQGLVWYYLARIRYRSDETATSGADGRASFRGFKGDYALTIRYGESEYTELFSLENDLDLTVATPLGQGKIVTVDLPAVADSYVQSNQPTKTPGTEKVLNLRWSGQASNFVRMSYLKFEVGPLPYPIQYASLYLYSNTEVDPVNALAVDDSSWTESSLQWNNRPAPGEMLGSGQPVAPGRWFSIDLPLPLNDERTYSFALDETGNTFHNLSSREGDHPPYLRLAYIVPDTDEDGIADDLDQDDDGDYLPDTYEALIQTDPLVGGDGEMDHDLDGLKTLLEFALAMDPRSADLSALSGGLKLEATPGGMRMTYQQRRGLAEDGIDLFLQHSTTLGFWENLVDSTDFATAGLSITSTVTEPFSDAYGVFDRTTIEMSANPVPGFFRFEVEGR